MMGGETPDLNRKVSRSMDVLEAVEAERMRLY